MEMCSGRVRLWVAVPTTLVVLIAARLDVVKIVVVGDEPVDLQSGILDVSGVCVAIELEFEMAR